MVLIRLQDIDVDFPYDPYECQIEYMSKSISALRRGENALLESPTGTGKTLCLLCSTLAWQEYMKQGNRMKVVKIDGKQTIYLYF